MQAIQLQPNAPPLDRDIGCIGCGYNLRGLNPSGACPECGRVIDETLRGNWLATADPRWVAAQAFGAAALAIALASSLIMRLGYRLLMGSNIAELLYDLLLAAGYVAAGFALTAREPAAIHNESQIARFVPRALAVVIAAQAAAYFLYLRPFLFPGATRGFNLFGLMYLVTFSELARAGLLWLLLRRIARLAVRLPSRVAARTAAVLAWLLPVSPLLAMLVAWSSWRPKHLGWLILSANLLDLIAHGVGALLLMYSGIAFWFSGRALWRETRVSPLPVRRERAG